MEAKKQILIVEDEQFLMDLYRKIFSQRGYTVLEAQDGAEALKILVANKANVILLDIMLPKMDGITVLRKLKEESNPAKNISVVMLTNLGQESVIKEALRLGADGYILKSKYLPNQVVDEVEKLLETKKS